jgi:hypothetical protein
MRKTLTITAATLLALGTVGGVALASNGDQDQTRDRDQTCSQDCDGVPDRTQDRMGERNRTQDRDRTQDCDATCDGTGDEHRYQHQYRYTVRTDGDAASFGPKAHQGGEQARQAGNGTCAQADDS